MCVCPHTALGMIDLYCVIHFRIIWRLFYSSGTTQSCFSWEVNHTLNICKNICSCIPFKISISKYFKRIRNVLIESKALVPQHSVTVITVIGPAVLAELDEWLETSISRKQISPQVLPRYSKLSWLTYMQFLSKGWRIIQHLLPWSQTRTQHWTNCSSLVSSVPCIVPVCLSRLFLFLNHAAPPSPKQRMLNANKKIGR